MKIAVVGGGFSGLLSAYLIEKENVTATVFEKNSYLGGHCHTIVSGDIDIELGTVFSFPEHIKSLLIDLKVEYSERFTHRNFVDSQYERVEHIPQDDIGLLIEELGILESIFNKYQTELKSIDYGPVPVELKTPFESFLNQNNLNTIAKVIAPHFSSFGFGRIDEISTYYAFKIFTSETIKSFMRNEKLLFINKGTSALIQKMCENISDIRYGMEVKSIVPLDKGVRVDTDFGSEIFDKVLVTTKLGPDVIQDDFLSQSMEQIRTNPYMTCAYEVEGKNIATTYYKDNFGKKGKIHFFHIFKHLKRTVLVAYAYGSVSKDIVDGIGKELELTGIKVKRLIAVKQWHMFPHVNFKHVDDHFYENLSNHNSNASIYFAGSLVSKPSISNLYLSIMNIIPKILDK